MKPQLCVFLLWDGYTNENAALALQVWYRNPQLRYNRESRRLWRAALDDNPDLAQKHEEEFGKMLNGQPMSDSTTGMQLKHPESLISLVSAVLNILGAENIRKVPEIDNAIKQAVEQATVRVKLDVEQATVRAKLDAEQALREERVNGLLHLLQSKSIVLPPHLMQRLRSRGLAALPPLGAALNATGTEDFAQRANL